MNKKGVKQQEYRRRYYQEHKEKAKKYFRQYYREKKLRLGIGNKPSVMLTHQGKTQRLSDWAKELGMSRQCLHARLKYFGWSVEDALTVEKAAGRQRGSYRIKVYSGTSRSTRRTNVERCIFCGERLNSIKKPAQQHICQSLQSGKKVEKKHLTDGLMIINMAP